jgi:hypothetical protein
MLPLSIQDSHTFVKHEIVKPATDGSHPWLDSRSNSLFDTSLVELRGLEPLTPSVQRRCSPELSYSPLPSISVTIPLLLREFNSPQHPSLSTGVSRINRVGSLARSMDRNHAFGAFIAPGPGDGIHLSPQPPKQRGPSPPGPGPTMNTVGHSGLEPETSPLSEECSSQLS